VQIITHARPAFLDVGADAAGVAEIARRSRGTPRVANRLLKRVARLRAGSVPGVKSPRAVAAEALKRLDVDEFGLDDMDARILKAIIENVRGRVRWGVQTVAAAVGEDPGTLEEVYEPFLMQQGFPSSRRTSRAGRVATFPRAYRHFGFRPTEIRGAGEHLRWINPGPPARGQPNLTDSPIFDYKPFRRKQIAQHPLPDRAGEPAARARPPRAARLGISTFAICHR